MNSLVDSPPQGRAPAQGAAVPGSYVEASSAGLQLLASRCGECGQRVFPPASMCPFCLSPRVATFALTGPATLYCFSTVHVAPAAWATPYTVGYADFECGVRIFAKLDPDCLWQIGAPVRLKVHAAPPDARFGAAPRYHYHLTVAPA